VISGSILEENLRPFVEVLGWQVDYRLSDADWEMIAAGLEGTDADHWRWAEFTLRGGPPWRFSALLRYAWTDPGAGVPYVDVMVESVPSVEAVATTAIQIMWNYRICPDR
jgi:hypothetical protein